MTRPLLAALLIALAAHVAALTFVGILVPEGPGRNRAYTKVDFLGPILGKTAFELMLEQSGPDRYTFYMQDPAAAAEDLAAPYPRTTASAREAIYAREMDLGKDISDFLAGERSVPDLWGYTTGNDHPVMWDDRRRIIYRPLMPSVPAGFYGSQKRFKVLVNAFVNAEGHVLRAQTVTTTGYPQIDMLASKYVESWMYEPRARRMTDEKPDRIEIELELGQSE